MHSKSSDPTHIFNALNFMANRHGFPMQEEPWQSSKQESPQQESKKNSIINNNCPLVTPAKASNFFGKQNEQGKHAQQNENSAKKENEAPEQLDTDPNPNAKFGFGHKF